MQWHNRLGSVSGALKRREHVLNDLAHVHMPQRLHWGLLGFLSELSWDPLGAGRLSLATGGGGKEYGRRNERISRAMTAHRLQYSLLVKQNMRLHSGSPAYLKREEGERGRGS